MCECLATDLRERCVGRPFLAHIFEILPLPAYPRDILEREAQQVTVGLVGLANYAAARSPRLEVASGLNQRAGLHHCALQYIK